MPKPPQPTPLPQATKPDAVTSVGIMDLLKQDHVCRMIARNFPELRLILIEIQLGITNETNRDEVGPTILALKKIHDTLLLFQARGQVIISAEAAEDARKNK